MFLKSFNLLTSGLGTVAWDAARGLVSSFGVADSAGGRTGRMVASVLSRGAVLRLVACTEHPVW